MTERNDQDLNHFNIYVKVPNVPQQANVQASRMMNGQSLTIGLFSHSLLNESILPVLNENPVLGGGPSSMFCYITNHITDQVQYTRVRCGNLSPPVLYHLIWTSQFGRRHLEYSSNKTKGAILIISKYQFFYFLHPFNICE